MAKWAENLSRVIFCSSYHINTFHYYEIPEINSEKCWVQTLYFTSCEQVNDGVYTIRQRGPDFLNVLVLESLLGPAGLV